MADAEASAPEPPHQSQMAEDEEPTITEMPHTSSPPLPVSRRSSSFHEPPGFVHRVHVPKPPVDLRQVEYVSKVDDNLVCSICHCPFDTPLRIVACDHVFCKDCLKYAFAAQSNSLKNCPTCRTYIERDPEPVQRLLVRILDELVIKCPNHELGCGWENKRIDAQDHIELYCDHTMVECPDKHCDQEIMQKDFHKGCLHQTVVCQHCHTSMMKKDLEQHEKDVCPNRFASCPHCAVDITRCDLPSHLKDECPKTTMKCSGHVCGCSFESERAVAAHHSTTCPMAIMAPTILAQKARQDEQDKAHRLLQRKIDIFEGGLTALQSMLYPGNSTPTPTNPAIDPFATQAPAAEQPFPPLESQIQEILSLLDNVREQVNRWENSLADLDSRMHLHILNEQQRNRDDMLHVNGALSTMRMQLHWLISSGRTQAFARATTASPAAVSTTAGSSSGAGGTRFATRPDGLPLRRLSDSNRQDTKL